MNLNLPINWFDFLLVAVIIIGLRQGRKHGMSDELMSFLMWITILIACAFLYQPVGLMISQSTVFSLLASYLMAYIGLGLIISAIFAYLKRGLGGKLVGSDVFGQSEFYLGMVAGSIRCVCILLAVLALLNARAYNSVEIRNDIKMQNEVYGSTFFPKLYSVQASVFQTSMTGPLIKDYLGMLLIKPTPPEQKQIKRKELAAP